MTKGDGAAVDIDLLVGDVVFDHPCERHAGERLVAFEEVDVINRHAGLGEGVLGGRDRTREHVDGIVAADTHVVDPGSWREAVILDRLFAGDQQRRRRIGDLACDGSSDASAFDERRELLHLLDGAAAARPLIHRAVAHGDDLVVEAALVDGLDGSFVAREGERLHLVAADVPLLRDHLGAPELGDFLGPVPIDPSLRTAERIVEAEIGGEGHGGGDRDL